MSQPTEEADRLGELLNIGAGHAAGAFAGLLGRTFWMQVPRVYLLEARTSQDVGARAQESPRTRQGADTGIFFEVSGPVHGVVGLLLTTADRDRLAVQLLGSAATEAPLAMLESAIRELGNIVVSHVCSAIADTLGARVVPSVPVLTLEGAEDALDALLAQRRVAGLRVESEIFDEARELRGLLVFVPDRREDP